MERNFDLHVSVQFKGGQYFRSFSAKTYTEFENALRDAWYDTGLSMRTGEIFIFTTIDLEDGPYEFELGYYKVEEDNETIIGITHIPELGSPEHIICTILDIDINDKTLRFNEEEFFSVITRAIIKHQKSWSELSQKTHKKIEKLQQDLENQAKEKLKKEAYYQCTACNWKGSSRERLTQYFDFNQEPAEDPQLLRERLNSGPNHDEQWLKSGYIKLCPKCLEKTKITEDGEALFLSAMHKRQISFNDSSFGGLFRGKPNAQELARIEFNYFHEEARICCNPTQLYESIRFRKLNHLYDQIMGNCDGTDLLPENEESNTPVRLFDELYKEVFFETLQQGA